MRCYRCKRKFEENEAFCATCGLSRAIVEKNRRIKIIEGIIFVVGIICLILLFWIYRDEIFLKPDLPNDLNTRRN